MKKAKSHNLWLPLLTILLLTHTAQAQSTPTPQNHAKWLADAKWGIFVHYLYDTVVPDGPSFPAKWNQAVESVDVDTLAERIASTGAGYLMITIGQNSGYYCAPNKTYDQLTKATTSKCSNRDLIADLATALHKQNIPLLVYLPSGAPENDLRARKNLEWTPGHYPLWTYENGNPKGTDPRLESFQNKWESIIREWSHRWGKNIAGWWFDGCYFPDAMYRFPTPPNFTSLANTARTGNPNAIIAFNPGITSPIITLTPAEDYTAGETEDPEKIEYPDNHIDHTQLHLLSYLGPNWSQSPPRYPDKTVITITKKINQKGGAITWEVPIQANGLIPQPFIDQLRNLGKATGKILPPLPN